MNDSVNEIDEDDCDDNDCDDECLDDEIEIANFIEEEEETPMVDALFVISTMATVLTAVASMIEIYQRFKRQ